jgi:hypothetical protein
MSTVYRERERERERDRDRDRDRYDDSRSSFSSAPRGGNYATVKRYRVGGDDDTYSTTFDGRRYGARDPPARVEETKIVRREREEPEARPESNYGRRDRAPDTRWEDDIVIRRTKEADELSRREYKREEPSTDRELVIRRTSERDGYDRERDFQVERYDDRRRDYRDYAVISPSHESYGDLQKYSRTAEYYAQPSQPQTIIIRNDPIIIRERVRDDDYAMIHRSEVEDRQVTRREPSPVRQEELFYERKTTERDSKPMEKEEDFYARREVSPGDSISQVGRRRRSRSRGRSRYSDSDESMVYVRRETKESSRSQSPHHRRHIAEGALAGFGAAELLRHHKKSSGKETSGPVGRLGKDVGAGVLGAVAAQGISKAKSRQQSKSRRRERSESSDRDDRRSRRHHSRTRSETRSHSHSHLKTLGGLALAAAAAGTAVAVASKKKNQNDPEERRSRSRHRRHSASEAADDARNPGHRNKRMAEAGAAGAAVAGLIEHHRSKSRKRKGERSRSVIRTGLPIAAAGLGSAAIAGIYERNKASREMEEAAATERKRSRSRSRARSTYSDAPRGATTSDPNLIEYGNGPMYGNIPQADYYGRGPAAHDPYYAEAMVPAAAAAAAGAAYGGQREPRQSHSRDRRPSSSESSDGGRRRRHRRHSRSRSRDVATPALAALGGGIAATEYAKRKEKKKAEKLRRRAYHQPSCSSGTPADVTPGHEAEHGHDPYEDEFDPGPRRFTPTPPTSADPYGNPNHYYRPDEQIPPPPGSAPPPLYPQQQQQPHPQAGGYPPPQGSHPAQSSYNPGGYSQQAGPPPPTNPAYPSQQNPTSGAGYSPGTPYASGGNGDPRYPRGRGDENVSAPPSGNFFPGEPRHASPDGTSSVPPRPVSRHGAAANDGGPTGVSKPRVPSPSRWNPPPAPRSSSQPPPGSKNVAFDLGSDGSQISSPDIRRHRRKGETNRGYEAEDDSESTLDGRDKRYPTHHPVEETESDPEQAARRARRRRPRPNDDRSHDDHRHHRSRRSSRSHHPPARDGPLSPTGSDATVELPDRFDREGRRKPEKGDDPLADMIENMMSGKGPGGKYFKKLFGSDDDENHSGGRRRKR